MNKEFEGKYAVVTGGAAESAYESAKSSCSKRFIRSCPC